MILPKTFSCAFLVGVCRLAVGMDVPLCPGVILECVDYRNYPPDVCAALKAVGDDSRSIK